MKEFTFYRLQAHASYNYFIEHKSSIKLHKTMHSKDYFDKKMYIATKNKLKDARSVSLRLYTLIISHKSSNMLRILNKLTLYKELQTFVTNNVFWDKKVKTQQQQNKKSNIKTLAEAGD